MQRKRPSTPFRKVARNTGWSSCGGLHDAVAKRMDQLVEATVVEYGAPQDRAKGSNNLAANIFLHFKKVLEDFDLVKTVSLYLRS